MAQATRRATLRRDGESCAAAEADVRIADVMARHGRSRMDATARMRSGDAW
jgi:hypothetical protein